MNFLHLFESTLTLFHLSPSTNRTSILQHGLNPKLGKQRYPGHAYPKGIYLWSSEEDASQYAYSMWEAADLWEVRVSKDILIDDPEPAEHNEAPSFLVLEPIPPAQLKFISSWHPDPNAEWGEDRGEWVP